MPLEDVTPLKVDCHTKPNGEALIRTEFGAFRFIGFVGEDGAEQLALVAGDVAGRSDVLCRVHSECLTGEVFRSRRCDCRAQLELAMQLVQQAGRGVIIYLRQEGRGIGLHSKLQAYALQDERGLDTLDANLELGFEGDLRSYADAACILQELDVNSIVLMTNNPDKEAQLKKLGVVVARRQRHVAGLHEENQAYFDAKASRMGHDPETE